MENLEKLIGSLFFKDATKELAKDLNKNQKVDSYTTSCGSILLDDNEEVQVQITVTRKKEDFLGAFDIIEHKTM